MQHAQVPFRAVGFGRLTSGENCVVEPPTEPVPIHIALVYDMLTMTMGAHDRAAQAILSNRFLQTVFVGLFLSRWVYTSKSEDFSGSA